MRRQCYVCGAPDNHGWEWRTDCNRPRWWVDGDDYYEAMDTPYNDIVVSPWEPIRRARIDRAVAGLRFP